MRPYRAWIIEENKMVKVISIDLCPEFGGIWHWGKAYPPFDDGDHEADKVFVPWSKCKEMTGTGLHDRNGKEIYESDRVKFTTVRDDLTEGVVEWSDTGAYWMIKSKLPLLLHRAENIEVIGNIHETPNPNQEKE